MKICSVEGCNNSGKLRKSYCGKHYMQIRRHSKILKRTRFDPNEIIIKDNIAVIILYDKKNKETARTIIDAEDVEKIKNYKWYLSNGYVATMLEGRLVWIQHIILGIKPNVKIRIDHKNRNPLINRKFNLRFCTNAENIRNGGKRKNNTSGYKGVVRNREG